LHVSTAKAPKDLINGCFNVGRLAVLVRSYQRPQSFQQSLCYLLSLICHFVPRSGSFLRRGQSRAALQLVDVLLIGQIQNSFYHRASSSERRTRPVHDLTRRER
jgi:hypothetical protein